MFNVEILIAILHSSPLLKAISNHYENHSSKQTSYSFHMKCHNLFLSYQSIDIRYNDTLLKSNLIFVHSKRAIKSVNSRMRKSARIVINGLKSAN
ncbi:hypothetical protein DERP_001149 [Dermatophagoides pteronyssinus]|uniref:Uncharacterized protein n=1 Tax=Dermatophagoides pteronyssinus TaxID=6956 RepID=A0ABQ8JDT5_DERPT|nr:hypothetical protein DERP_001149 [Dermatophagoides pteronyssinus]